MSGTTQTAVTDQLHPVLADAADAFARLTLSLPDVHPPTSCLQGGGGRRDGLHPAGHMWRAAAACPPGLLYRGRSGRHPDSVSWCTLVRQLGR